MMRQRLSLNLLLSGGCPYTRLSPLTGEVMSWQAVTWVLERSEATLGSRLVLLSIASHSNREGRQAWPSVDTISLEAKLSRREVQYCVRELEDSGELHCVRGGGRGHSNHYELPFVAEWLYAQNVRGLEKGRNVEHKGRNPRQERAHPSAQEPSLEPSVTVNPRKLELRKLREEREKQDLLRRYSDRRVSR